MVYCSVVLCNNYSGTSNYINKGITFHRFPKDPDIKSKWISNTGRQNWFPSDNSRICSAHFKENYFITTKKRRYLAKSSIPTLNIWKSCSENFTADMPSTSTVATTTTSTLPPTPTRKRGVTLQANNLSSVCAEDDKSAASQPSSSSTDVKQTCDVLSEIPEGKVVILRVYHYLATEYEQLKCFTENSSDLAPLTNILTRTARATGVSEQTVTALLDEEKQSQDSVDDGGAPSKRQKVAPIVDYYDCNSPITEEEPSDSEQCEDNHSNAPEDGPQQSEHQQQYVYHIDAVKKEVDEEHTEQLVIFDTEEEEDPFYDETASAVAGISCTNDTEMKAEPPDDETTHSADHLSDSTEPHTAHSHDHYQYTN